MKRTTQILIIIAAIAVAVPAGAQIVLIDSTPTDITFTGFTGSGFSAAPAAGQLDSDEIRVMGLSDGDQTWGGTFDSGDHARGASSGGASSGGVYAGTDGDVFLMLQPGGSDVTPGSIELRFTNSTGGIITVLDLQYDVLVFNDQGRANSFNCEYSADGSSWVGIGPLMTTTPETADPPDVQWTRTTMGGPYGLITDIAVGSTFYVRWFTDDVSGGGSRDEIGIDNIHIAADTFPVELQSFSID